MQWQKKKNFFQHNIFFFPFQDLLKTKIKEPTAAGDGLQ